MILSEVDLINVARTRLGNASQSTVSQQVVSVQLDIDTKNYLGTNKKFANVVFNVVDVNGVDTWAYEGYALADTRAVPVLLNLPTLAILYDEWRSQGNIGAFIDFLDSLQGVQGYTGWTPMLIQVPLTGGRVVVKLQSFVGGEGTLPSELQDKIGKYQKADGTFTAEINEALDVAAELKAIVEQNTEAVEELAAQADSDRIAAENAASSAVTAKDHALATKISIESLYDEILEYTSLDNIEVMTDESHSVLGSIETGDFEVGAWDGDAYIVNGLVIQKNSKIKSVWFGTGAVDNDRALRLFRAKLVSGSTFSIVQISDAISTGSINADENPLLCDFDVEQGDYIGFIFQNGSFNISYKNSGQFASDFGWKVAKTSVIAGTDVAFTAASHMGDTRKMHFNVILGLVESKNVPKYMVAKTLAAKANINKDLAVTGTVYTIGTSYCVFPKNSVASVDGYITSVRFYAPTNNVDEFRIVVGTSNFPFTNITGISSAFQTSKIGWIDVIFSTPIRVKAGQMVGVTSKQYGCNYILNNSGHVDYGGFAVNFYLQNTGVYRLISQPNQRGFLLESTIEDESSALNKSNNANGIVILDNNKKLPVGSTLSTNQFAGKKILWIGTSIPAASSVQYPSYPELVGKKLSAIVKNNSQPSSYFVNRSWLGLTNTITEANAINAQGYLYSYETLIIGQDYDTLIIDHGVNDVLNWSSTAFSGTVDSTNRNELYGAFNYLLPLIYANKPTAKIVLITPPNLYTFSGISTHTHANFAALRTVLKNVSEKYSLPLLDLSILSNINSLNYAQYKSDGLHPKEQDRERLANIISNFLQNI